MRHLKKWERKQVPRYVYGRIEILIDRNERGMVDHICRYDECGNVCKLMGAIPTQEKEKGKDF